MESLSPEMIAGGAVLGALAVLLLVMVGRSERARADLIARMDHINDLSLRLSQAHSELGGRLHQAQWGVNERLDSLARRLGDGLSEQTRHTGETLRVLHERLAVIDAAQKNITELSTQMMSLQRILSDKQARGAFGEIQLRDLVTAALPPSAYAFQVTLANGTRADCLLSLPLPPGPIAVDAKFPLESYSALRAAADETRRIQAGRAFAADVLRHVKDIEEKYIVPGETADSALLFLPSEAVYAELHANFRNVVEESYRRKVWIVSPTTLWATLHTIRAVLKDVRLREQAGVIQAELRALAADVDRLDERVGKLQRHFEQAQEDVRQIRVSTDKVTRRTETIDERLLETAGEEAAAAAARGGDGKTAEQTAAQAGKA